MRLVTGYPGTNDIVLAMERGEVDGLCGMSWSTIKARHAEWLNRQEDQHPASRPRLQKEPELPDVPLASDFAKTPEQTPDPRFRCWRAR